MPRIARYTSWCVLCDHQLAKGELYDWFGRTAVHAKCWQSHKETLANAKPYRPEGVRLTDESVPECLRGLVSAHTSDRERDQDALAAYMEGKKRRQTPQEIADNAIKVAQARSARQRRQGRNRGL